MHYGVVHSAFSPPLRFFTYRKKKNNSSSGTETLNLFLVETEKKLLLYEKVRVGVKLFCF